MTGADMKGVDLKHLMLCVATLGAILFSQNCEARGTTAGTVKTLQHWGGHSGILVKLDATMTDPDACGRTDWYIMPDSSPHAQFVQALLLSAQASSRSVYITLDGCLQGLPQIFAIENSVP